MAVTVTKLEGDDIPADQRSAEVEQVFKVTDDTGEAHYCIDDVEAAKLAVQLSEEQKAP